MTKQTFLCVARKAFALLLIVTPVLMIAYAAYGIVSILHSPATSFPWTAAPAFALIYFGPVIVLEAAVYLILRAICRKYA